MTAGAMIIGMLPMALGFGEGGEQNAPLGRAVIGGLMLATITTLFIVPLVYSLLRTKPPVDFERRIIEEEHEYLRDEMLLRGDRAMNQINNGAEERLQRRNRRPEAAIGGAEEAARAGRAVAAARCWSLAVRWSEALRSPATSSGMCRGMRREQVLAAESQAGIESLPVVNVERVSARRRRAIWCCPAIFRRSRKRRCWRAPPDTSRSATWISATA